MANPDNCMHRELHFNSGDYYLKCSGCGAMWMRRAPDGRREYGLGADDKPIGAGPEFSNNGPGQHLSGHRRVADMDML